MTTQPPYREQAARPSQQEPADPEGGFYQHQVIGPSADQNGLDVEQRALPATLVTSSKPPLIVALANGWTATVEHPDSPECVLGRGGQGKIYRATAYDEEGNPRGQHALKQVTLGRVTPGYTQRRISDGESAEELPHGRVINVARGSLIREAALLRHIHRVGILRRNQAGVPGVITYGQDNESQYMLLEIIGGASLESHIAANKPLPTLQIMLDLLETVTDMESNALPPGQPGRAISGYGGLAYLDLKPANIIHDPATGRTVILDAGSAHGRLQKDYDPDSAKGSPIWMAPGQWDGEKQLLQINQYQLALIWLELRTNGGYSEMRKDMNPKNDHALCKHQTQDDMHWRGMIELMWDHNIPDEEQRIMIRALQHDPEMRWPSAQAMLAELVAYITPDGLCPPEV